jgi:hypothetical protein
MNPYFTALVSAIGVVIGASLQFWFSRLTTNWSRLQDKQIQAYVDFLKGVSGVAQSQRFKDKRAELDSSSLLADARARIAVYGHSEVLEALAEFDKTDRKLSSDSSLSAFMQLIQTMRKASNTKIAPISEAQLSLVLFG